MKNYSKILSDLSKLRITIFVAISSSVGYIMYDGQVSIEMIIAVVGVFFLASGLSAFNQFQEIAPDSLMNRTKSRPMPSGTIQPFTGFAIASILTIFGLILLYSTGVLVSFLLGLFAIVWYNLFYTPLKKRTALAVVPGALVGTIPPAIGWTSAGGSLLDPSLWALNLFIFIWQIPHFWLLLLIYEEDYKNAGFPVLTELFSSTQLRRVTYAWIISLVVSCLMIPLFNNIHNPVILISLLFAGVWLLWRTKILLEEFCKTQNYSFAFRLVNIYVLVTVVLISIDKLI